VEKEEVGADAAAAGSAPEMAEADLVARAVMVMAAAQEAADSIPAGQAGTEAPAEMADSAAQGSAGAEAAATAPRSTTPG
jgi:hypothetical protein